VFSIRPTFAFLQQACSKPLRGPPGFHVQSILFPARHQLNRMDTRAIYMLQSTLKCHSHEF
jgi:hypothetical protein